MRTTTIGEDGNADADRDSARPCRVVGSQCPDPKFVRGCGTRGYELRNQKGTGNVMIRVSLLSPKFAIGLAAWLCANFGLGTLAMANDDIVLRGMGSFHVGGRIVEISGKPVREIVLVPGGPPARM